MSQQGIDSGRCERRGTWTLAVQSEVMVATFEPETPGGLRLSMDCKLASNSATAEDMMEVVYQAQLLCGDLVSWIQGCKIDESQAEDEVTTSVCQAKPSTKDSALLVFCSERETTGRTQARQPPAAVA